MNNAVGWRQTGDDRFSPLSSRARYHLEENIGAAAVELTAADLSDIENAISQITVIGDRY